MVEPQDTSTEERAAATTVPEPSDRLAFEEYIAGQVEGFFHVRDLGFAAPSATPEVDYPELADFAAGVQLEVMHEAIRSKLERGLLTREPDEPLVGVSVDEEHRTSGIVSLDGDVVTVFNCELNDSVLFDAETGEVIDDRVITVLIVATLEKFDDGWKLTLTEATQKIEGMAGCYLASESEFPY